MPNNNKRISVNHNDYAVKKLSADSNSELFPNIVPSPPLKVEKFVTKWRMSDSSQHLPLLKKIVQCSKETNIIHSLQIKHGSNQVENQSYSGTK